MRDKGDYQLAATILEMAMARYPRYTGSCLQLWAIGISAIHLFTTQLFGPLMHVMYSASMHGYAGRLNKILYVPNL